MSEENKKISWQELADTYLQEEKQEETLEKWDRVSELSSSAEEKLLNTPELVKMYISKHGINPNLKEIIKKEVSNK